MRCATVTTADIQLRYLCNSNMCPEFQFSFSFLMILAHFTIIFSFGSVDSILGSHCGAPFFHQCRSKCKHTLVHTHKRARVIQCVSVRTNAVCGVRSVPFISLHVLFSHVCPYAGCRHGATISYVCHFKWYTRNVCNIKVSNWHIHRDRVNRVPWEQVIMNCGRFRTCFHTEICFKCLINTHLNGSIYIPFKMIHRFCTVGYWFPLISISSINAIDSTLCGLNVAIYLKCMIFIRRLQSGNKWAMPRLILFAFNFFSSVWVFDHLMMVFLGLRAQRYNLFSIENAGVTEHINVWTFAQNVHSMHVNVLCDKPARRELKGKRNEKKKNGARLQIVNRYQITIETALKA